MAPCKKARVNKNKKKNWKKHVDIKEVEEFLDDRRQDERLGGPVCEKADESIFFVQKDKTSESTAKKKNKLQKPLRCFQILQLDSVVPSPITPCRTRNLPKKNLALEEKRKMQLQKRVEQTLQMKQLKKTRALEKQNKFKSFDLWNHDNDMPTSKFDPTPPSVKVPVYRYQKPSLLPSVEVPHAGMSYNPTFEDHQELLLEAHTVEVHKVIEEDKLHRKLTQKFPTPAEAPTEASWLEEMSQGLFDEPENESDQEEEVNDSLKYSCIVQENRKPKAKKRREKEQKLKERKLQEMKRDKRRLNNVFKIKHLKKEILEAEEISKQRQEEKSKKEIKMMYQPRKICRFKYQAPDLELNLGEEIAGSLRKVKVEGNLLEDRYKSFQRRNIIEPRIRQKMKRKYKKKVFEKRGHKSVK